MSLLKKRIAVTLGDPYGIGPEVVIRAIESPEVRDAAHVLLVGSQDVFAEAIERYAPDLCPTLVDAADQAVDRPLVLLDTGGPDGDPPSPAGPTPHGGRTSLDAIHAGLEAVLSGAADALVTAPISKEAIRMAGCPHPGHTELLAHETSTRRPVMMMVGGGLRVSLVTIHLAMRKLPLHLDTEAILATIRITAKGLAEQFGIPRPRIAVCGLNPHAGESGLFGREETETIRPAVEQALQNGIDVEGPLPADTLFHQASGGKYDAVVAMYHDQGLIPVKLLAFDSGVNVTLGLPVIRTSPDHGTAYDIAGRGEANPGAMCAAIASAIKMAGKSTVI